MAFTFENLTKIYLNPFLLARGLGMRIVGGKAGADGRLFAYVVWTVPGGVAEKCGLQQGDKVKFRLFSEKVHCEMLALMRQNQKT